MQAVQCCLIFSGIFQMFCVGTCKYMRSGKISSGAKIQVICLWCMQHSIYGCGRWRADGAGGSPLYR